MARQPRRIVRGTNAQVMAYIGPLGELVLNVETGKIHLQDGSTPSGLIVGDTSGQVPGGRLTLFPGVPVTVSDVTGATSVHLTAAGAAVTSIYNGTDFVIRYFVDQVLGLDVTRHLAGKNYDVFHFWTGAAVNIGSGPAWQDNVNRGAGAGTTELELFRGRLVNRYPITLFNVGTTAVPARQATFAGSFGATVNGQTEDSLEKRLLSNFFNPVSRPMRRMDPALTWVYSANAFVPANNGSGFNRLEYLHCVADRLVTARVQSAVLNSTATARPVHVGIGLDSTSVNSCPIRAPVSTYAQNYTPLSADYDGYPGLGRHSLYWLERGAGIDTQTWYGTFSADARNGITARTLN